MRKPDICLQCGGIAMNTDHRLLRRAERCGGHVLRALPESSTKRTMQMFDRLDEWYEGIEDFAKRAKEEGE